MKYVPHIAIAVTVIACGSVLTACSGDRESRHPAAASTTQSASVATATSSAATSTSSAADAAKHFATVASVPMSSSTGLSGTSRVVVTSSAPYTAYSTDGTQLGVLNESTGGYRTWTSLANCGGVNVTITADAKSTLYALRSKDIPAAGLQVAARDFVITAWDTHFTGLWETPVATRPASQNSVDDCSSLGSTSNGRWLTVTAADTSSVLDMATGKVREIDFVATAFGNYLIKKSCASVVSEMCSLYKLTVVDPETLADLAEVVQRDKDFYDTGYQVLDTALRFSNHAAVLEDGTRVVVAQDGHTYLFDLATASIQRSWPLGTETRYGTVPFTLAVSGEPFVDAAGTRIVVLEGSTAGPEIDQLRTYSVQTGEELWKIPGVYKICAVGTTQIAIIANSQLVLLDRSTGKQLEYTTRPSSCDHRAAGYTFNDDGKVYKLVDTYR